METESQSCKYLSPVSLLEVSSVSYFSIFSSVGYRLCMTIKQAKFKQALNMEMRATNRRMKAYDSIYY
jgi:hypothetical protein